jgi:hypothetical protein
VNEEDKDLIVGALDSLGVALADHGHQWTDGERAIYEESIKTLWNMAEKFQKIGNQIGGSTSAQTPTPVGRAGSLPGKAQAGSPTDFTHIHIEHYFPKGYNPDEEPWKSIKAHYNAALAAERELHKGYVEAMDTCVADAIEEFKSNHHNPIIAELNKQLAAEREKVQKIHAVAETAIHALKGKLPNPDICERDRSGEALIEDLTRRIDALAKVKEAQ